MPKSSFYSHRALLDNKDKYADLKLHITTLYHKHKGRCGYRRITQTLQNEGIIHNHKLIAKFMRKPAFTARLRRQKYRSYKSQQGRS